MCLCSTGVFLYKIQPYDALWTLAQRYNTTIYAIAALNPGVDLNYLHVGQVIKIYPGYGYYPSSYCHVPNGIGKAEVDLMNDIRMLWEQHIAWTRMSIISMTEDLSDVDIVVKRLLQNPIDFEKALKPFYGDEKASKFSNLFKSHLVIAAQLVKAAKAGDNKAATEAEKKWYENADEIATFLSSINPYWSKEYLRKMLHEHLALTKSEAVDMLTKDYAASVTIYDEIEKQALKMADMMAKGIVNQFPNKFAE